MVFADLLRAFDLLRNSRKPRQQVHRPNAPLGLGKLEPLVAFEPRVDWRGNIVERAKELYLNVVSAFFRDFREGIEIVFVAGILWRVPAKNNAAAVRSEEHTSELQSHLNLVCRLLLEKKKYIKKERDTPV